MNHVMAKGAETPALATEVANIMQANARDSVYLAKEKYLQNPVPK